MGNDYNYQMKGPLLIFEMQMRKYTCGHMVDLKFCSISRAQNLTVQKRPPIKRKARYPHVAFQSFKWTSKLDRKYVIAVIYIFLAVIKEKQFNFNFIILRLF